MMAEEAVSILTIEDREYTLTEAEFTYSVWEGGIIFVLCAHTGDMRVPESISATRGPTASMYGPSSQVVLQGLPILGIKEVEDLVGQQFEWRAEETDLAESGIWECRGERQLFLDTLLSHFQNYDQGKLFMELKGRCSYAYDYRRGILERRDLMVKALLRAKVHRKEPGCPQPCPGPH